jgi:hypothetical protein
LVEVWFITKAVSQTDFLTEQANGTWLAKEEIMKKLAALVAGLAVCASLAFGVLAAGVASAAEPDGELEAELGPRPWLRESIVLAAARTIGVAPETVREALLRGVSLKELGLRHGDGPNELAFGIITHERAILDNWVDDGRITREQAVHGNRFVETHIRLIINNHFEPGPF